MRGRGRGGASRAAMKAFHCAAFKTKVRRSASASSAPARALSGTNSLTERCATLAAACNARFASAVSLRSSFSLRVGLVPVSSFAQGLQISKLGEAYAGKCVRRHRLSAIRAGHAIPPPTRGNVPGSGVSPGTKV